MDDAQIGNAIRVLRVRARLRQADVARRARVSRQLVGRLEHGLAGRYPLASLRAVGAALGMSVDVRVRWQGGELDRVLSASHARLHETVAGFLGTLPGWTWRPEVSFSIYGERGVIDILAWHAATRSLLIIELKTQLVDPQDLVATMHRRARLGRTIAHEQGWHPATVSVWVVVLESSTQRRRLKRHARLLRGAFPAEGRTMRGWLVRPRGTISALSFWSHVASGSTGEVERRHATSRAASGKVQGPELSVRTGPAAASGGHHSAKHLRDVPPGSM